MASLSSLVPKIRSKNAGPFWLTVDIFCDTHDVYDTVRLALSTEAVAGVFNQPEELVRRFELADLRVVKFSLPRPAFQGSVEDRDMHGASWAALVGQIEI